MSSSALSRVATKSVLIVDDLTMMREIVGGLVTKLGFGTIDKVADGASALALLHERHHDLVISDLQMTPMSGMELLRAVRANSMLKETAFLMMTARMDTQAVIQAKRAGVDHYLVKPFTFQALRAQVEAILS